jgi:lipopolysaccharide export system permease protein
LPFVVVIALVALLVGPWANRQANEYKVRFAQRDDVSMVAPGQFRESAANDRVFFVESVNEDQTAVRNVFVTQMREGRLTVVASSGGRIETHEDGLRYLVLEDGRRWDGPWGGTAYRLMEFERYGVLLQPKAAPGADESAKYKTTAELLADPTRPNRGELLWRIGLPVSGVLTVLLAIPLAFVNPRVGQSANLVVAVLLYVIYNNALGLMQAWVAQGKLSFPVALVLPHAIVFLLFAGLMWRRTSIMRIRWPWPRRRDTAAPEASG